jgi:hypothetical protein
LDEIYSTAILSTSVIHEQYGNQAGTAIHVGTTCRSFSEFCQQWLLEWFVTGSKNEVGIMAAFPVTINTAMFHRWHGRFPVQPQM